jgi:ribulose-5-phosphate 4-epimerase/fuculose-1-phosphate aldolase
MDNALQPLCRELALAHHILIDQGVLEAFGHISVRTPGNPDRFLLPAAGAPACMTAADMLVFGMDGEPAQPTEARLFSERFIHAAIYRARPDVMAICHHHSPSIMPFCITGTPLRAVSQTGSSMGTEVPVWDSRTDFGDTKLLVTTDDEADALARALGRAWMVLMRRHGATVVGTSLKEMVFRAVHYCRDADHQLRAAALGPIAPLSAAECALAGQLRAEPVARCWEHWKALLPSRLNDNQDQAE